MNIIDTTLREGEQTPGLSFSLSEKKMIVDHLAKTGVDEIEIGISSSFYSHTTKLANYIKTKHRQMRYSLWSRCTKEDIQHGASLMPSILSLSIPVSDLHLMEKLGKSRDWAKDTMVNSILYAQKLGLEVGVGFEDGSRADKTFLKEMAALAAQHGSHRIRLADTVGIATPDKIKNLIETVRQTCKTIPIGVHCHNDFGMATANSITALQNGGSFADATILGLGERAGCCRLEEIIGFLTLNKEKNYNLRNLCSFATFMSKITKRDIQPNHPLLGSDIFTCETGLHLQGLQNNPATYEPFPPEKIGTQRTLHLTSKAGKRAIINYLNTLGLNLTTLNDWQVSFIRRILKQAPIKLSGFRR